MPAKRELTMRQLRHLLRLHYDGVSAREIGRRLGVARSTIQDNLKRAAAADLKWPLPDDVTDAALECRLFAKAGVEPGQRRRIEPDWAELARELKRPGVNLTVLWEEYREIHPEGYGYSRFCDLLRGFERRLTPVMRQHHVAGDKAFVDYSGKKIGIADPSTGEIREAEIFVAVLGASNLTYAEATWTQKLPDWTSAHARMFRFFGGAPRLLVPDNLKSGVNKASFYDPEINRTYGAMASHYAVGVLPARPRKPRDKAKVEAGVRFAQTYILGRLRRQIFFSLAECNAAIALAIQRMNERPMRKLGISRRELFEKVERDALSPLPAADWEFAEWLHTRVSLDYHIEVHEFLYSVPHAPRSMCESPPARSRYSIAASASPPISVATAGAGTALILAICRVHIGVTPIGPRIGSAAGPARSGQTPKGWSSRCSPAGRIPNRASAPALESSAFIVASSWLARRRFRSAPSKSAPSLARASRPSSPTSATRPLRTTPSRRRSSNTPTCVAPAITIERKSSCSLIRPSNNCTLSAFTAWPKGSRNSNIIPKFVASITQNGSA